jgi:hypothetical protein
MRLAFAHLVLSGKVTDREAAERAGIDPGRSAYLKAKPRMKAYMEEYRAAVRANLVQREVSVFQSSTSAESRSELSIGVSRGLSQ